MPFQGQKLFLLNILTRRYGLGLDKKPAWPARRAGLGGPGPCITGGRDKSTWKAFCEFEFFLISSIQVLIYNSIAQCSILYQLYWLHHKHYPTMDSANQSATIRLNLHFERNLLTLLLQERIAQSPTGTESFSAAGDSVLLRQRLLGTLWKILLDYSLSKLSHVPERALPQNTIFQSFSAVPAPSNSGHDWGDISLLVLHPSSRANAMVVGTIRKANIRDATQSGYEVLSYAIEDRAETVSIQLNDNRVEVPENLEAALKQLRDPEKPRVLWVDILCAGEGEPQIDLIKHIYAQAQKVTVWLGAGSPTSKRAMNFANQFKQLPHDTRRLLVSWLWKHPDIKLSEYEPDRLQVTWSCFYRPLNVRQARGFEFLPKVAVRDEHSRSQIAQIMGSTTAVQLSTAIVGLMRKTWWNRAWLLQEILSGCKVQIRCGQDVASWENFTELFDMILEVGLGDKVFSDTYPTDSIRETLLRYHNRATLVTNYGYQGTAIIIPRPFQAPPFRPAVMDQIIMQTPRKLLDESEGTRMNAKNEETYIIEAFAHSISRILKQPDEVANAILATAKIAGNLGIILNELSVRVSTACVRRIRENTLQVITRGGANFLIPRKGEERKITEIQRKLRVVSPRETLEGYLRKLRQQELDGSYERLLRDTGLPSTAATIDDDEDVRCWLHILHTVGTTTRSMDRNPSGIQGNEPSNAETYSYEALNHVSQEIRLLILHHGETNDNIHVELLTVSLLALASLGINRYPYVALSYTWGDGPTKNIWLHGRLKTVTSNLFAALQRLRDPHKPVLLWVDALCIDQLNDSEKSKQISLMATIYQKAGHVFAWTGEEDSDSWKVLLPLSLHDYEMALNRYPADPRIQKGIRDVWDFIRCPDQVQILRDMFSRPYWSRVWIVQELVLAPNLTICYGPYVASWEAYKSLCGYYGAYCSPINCYYSGDNRPPPAILAEIQGQIVKKDHNASKISLLNALTLGRERSATNPLDYIYAFLPLTNLGKSKVTIDYKNTLLSASIDAFWGVFEEEGTLDILSACRQYSSREDFEQAVTEPWPTWLPNWSFKGHTNSGKTASMLLSGYMSDRAQFYAAAGKTEPLVHFSLDNWRLILSGFCFDTITYVSEDEWPESMAQDWASYLHQSQEGRPYHNERALHVALAETTFLSRTTFPPKTFLMPYNEDSLISHAELFLGFGFDGTERMEQAMEEDLTRLGGGDIEDIMEEYSAITEDRHGEIDEIIRHNDSTDTLGDEFWTIAGERVAFSDLTDNKLAEISKESRNQLEVWLQTNTYKSRFFFTEKGYIGRGPLPVQKGDLVCILFGAKMPFILQETLESGVYTMLGEACKYKPSLDFVANC